MVEGVIVPGIHLNAVDVVRDCVPTNRDGHLVVILVPHLNGQRGDARGTGGIFALQRVELLRTLANVFNQRVLGNGSGLFRAQLEEVKVAGVLGAQHPSG